MSKRTAEEAILMEDSISFRRVNNLSELQTRLSARGVHNEERIKILAFSDQAQAQIERFKLLGEQELIRKLLSEL